MKYDYTADPGTAYTAKAFQLISGALAHKQTVDSPYGYQMLTATAAKSGLTVPARALALGLMPDGDAEAYDNRGGHWMRNLGERVPIRGGDWGNGAGAGASALRLHNPRSNADGYLGVRAAYFGNL